MLGSSAIVLVGLLFVVLTIRLTSGVRSDLRSPARSAVSA
jgi:hypothetical protein